MASIEKKGIEKVNDSKGIQFKNEADVEKYQELNKHL